MSRRLLCISQPSYPLEVSCASILASGAFHVVLGGKGKEYNWTPAPNSVNTGPQVLHSFEFSLKRLLKEERKKRFNVVWIRVNIPARRSPSPRTGGLSGFAREVSFEAGLEFPVKGEWKPDLNRPQIKEDVPVPEPEEGYVPSLSRPSRTALSALDPIFTQTTVKRMKNAAPFSGPESFVRKMLNQVPGDSKWTEKVQKVAVVVDGLVKEKKLKIEK